MVGGIQTSSMLYKAARAGVFNRFTDQRQRHLTETETEQGLKFSVLGTDFSPEDFIGVI